MSKETRQQYSLEIISELLEERYGMLQQEYQHNSQELDKDFISACKQFFQQCEREQQEEIAFIQFHYLRWAVQQEEIQIQMTAYGKDYYLAPEVSFHVWHPITLNQAFKSDLAQFQSIAKKRIIGYQYLDYVNIKEECATIYFIILGKYIQEKVKQIEQIQEYVRIKKKPECKLLYGGYIEEGTVIYPVQYESAG